MARLQIALSSAVESTAKHLATALSDLYSTTFAGKGEGRFFLNNVELRLLCGEQPVTPVLLGMVNHILNEDHNLVLVKTGAGYGVMELTKVMSWRKPPRRLLDAMAAKAPKSVGHTELNGINTVAVVENKDVFIQMMHEYRSASEQARKDIENRFCMRFVLRAYQPRFTLRQTFGELLDHMTPVQLWETCRGMHVPQADDNL